MMTDWLTLAAIALVSLVVAFLARSDRPRPANACPPGPGERQPRPRTATRPRGQHPPPSGRRPRRRYPVVRFPRNERFNDAS
jgi:hypothetical protein